MPKLQKIPTQTRKEAKKKANGFCYLCGLELKLYKCNIDHIVPVSKGGENSLENLIYVHIKCNQKKAGKRNTEYQNNRLKFILKNQ